MPPKRPTSSATSTGKNAVAGIEAPTCATSESRARAAGWSLAHSATGMIHSSAST